MSGAVMAASPRGIADMATRYGGHVLSGLATSARLRTPACLRSSLRWPTAA